MIDGLAAFVIGGLVGTLVTNGVFSILKSREMAEKVQQEWKRDMREATHEVWCKVKELETQVFDLKLQALPKRK